MSAFKEIYNQFENLKKEDRIIAARGASSEILEYLNSSGFSDEFKSSFFVILIGSLIGVDGTVTEAEVEVFNVIFSSEYTAKDLVKTISQLSTKENMEMMDRIIDSVPEKIKLAACILCLAVISSDGIVNEEEAKFFEKILA